MRSNTRNWFICVAMAVGIFLFTALPTYAAIATGSAEITNIQYNLVNPGDGTINWFYDNSSGGPDWHGEAWVEAQDSLGGFDADYSITPDGLGLIDTFASTALAWGQAQADLTNENLYGESYANAPVDEWSMAAEYAKFYDYFSIEPTIPGSTNPIELAVSFDYNTNLTGQAEPGASYFSDAAVNMQLEYEDAFGNFRPVTGGDLFFSDVIRGSGLDFDDITHTGTLQTTVWLDPDTNHLIGFST